MGGKREAASGRDFPCCDRGEHDALRVAIGGVTFNVMNFPERVQSRLLGQDMAPLNTKLTAAVLGSAWLAEMKAAAWDEGRASLADDIVKPLRDDYTREQTRNPYRHNDFDHCPGCQAAHQTKEAQK